MKPNGQNSRETIAYLAVEEAIIERLLADAAADRDINPENSMFIMIEAKRRAKELLATQEQLGLQ